MTKYLPKPSSSDPSFTRALSAWRAEQGHDAPNPEAGERDTGQTSSGRTFWFYAPYAVALVLALGAGASFASLATTPALNDSIETVAAIDARDVGFAANLDPSGQQKKAATLSRDVGAMKSEITRLQRALDQAKTNQSAQTKTAAGQAAQNFDEVKTLKSEIANLQKTLDGTRGEAAAKIEGLTARIEQSKGDNSELAALRARLERFEKFAQADKTPAPKRTEQSAPETTGSVGRDDQRAAAAQSPQPTKQPAANEQLASRDESEKVVRNWTVREVVRGVALLEGRQGMIEVVRGAKAPGMGRVRSIERRDGQWVVVTDRGIVLERNEL